MKKINKEREKRENTKFSVSKVVVFFALAVFALVGLGCQPNPTILKDVAPPTPTPLSTVDMKKTTVEDDLREMRTANFDYIFVFRRKDGGVFDKEDRKYLRENTPPETNRWRESDEGKAFIAGSGFGFAPQQLEALQKRFVVEDYSKPEVKESADSAANSSVNSANANSNKTPANK